jgi:hypothetical protein
MPKVRYIDLNGDRHEVERFDGKLPDIKIFSQPNVAPATE